MLRKFERSGILLILSFIRWNCARVLLDVVTTIIGKNSIPPHSIVFVSRLVDMLHSTVRTTRQRTLYIYRNNIKHFNKWHEKNSEITNNFIRTKQQILIKVWNGNWFHLVMNVLQIIKAPFSLDAQSLLTKLCSIKPLYIPKTKICTTKSNYSKTFIIDTLE